MLEIQAAFARAGIPFAPQAVAITQTGSKLHQIAQAEGWRDSLPMWDWVGGRTSVLSAVGLLPAALQGFDIAGLLRGAALMDSATRESRVMQNPAALLALMWYHCSGGAGLKDMVILPYKDRLSLFSKYLQQLVMESLGKEFDRAGRQVFQGLAVYGNKGSTDQHAYVQQLREGVPNFFATFIQVLHDRAGSSLAVEPEITSGDYLNGLLLGTREALSENRRDSITVTVQTVDAATLGALIALYERAVGLYAEIVNINAYHQPGVEAGKQAAAQVLDVQRRVLKELQQSTTGQTAQELATAIGLPERVEWVYKILEHLAANPERRVQCDQATNPATARFSV
jgi:glucose-6-phosphate isomerase